MNLEPIYKWTGGKRKEIKKFIDFYPEFVKTKDFTFVEPFFGGGAVYWDINAQNYVINDIDYDLINFCKILQTDPEYIITQSDIISKQINIITEQEKSGAISIAEAKKQRGLIYYYWRDKDRNNGLVNITTQERAFRFYLVNQLAFNGMRRFNSKGEFNIPYGNYKTFNLKLTSQHLEKLKLTNIHNTNYKEVIENNDNEKTFIFIDPPYTREFKEYSHENVFGEKQQLELFETFKNTKNASIMIIINKDEFTETLYKDYIKAEYDVKYSTNIKNRFDGNVKHLVITNY